MPATERTNGEEDPCPLVRSFDGPHTRDVARVVSDDQRRLNGGVSARIQADARMDLRYALLIVFSCVIATLGLIADSAAVVIGAMLVAPLLGPITAVAEGAVAGRPGAIRRPGLAILGGACTAVALSAFLAWAARTLPFDALATLPNEVQARTRPNPFDLGVAIAGGGVGAYALARLPSSAALPGVAIATALMPPLCTVGIGIALADRGVWGGAMLLFVTNLSAIVFAGIVVFRILGFGPSRAHGLHREAFVAGFLVVLVGGLLAALALRAAAEAREAGEIRRASDAAIEQFLPSSRLVDFERSSRDGGLELSLTVRTVGEVHYEEVEAIQAAIAQRLQRRVAVLFFSVPTFLLDPLNAPPRNVSVTPAPRPSPSPTLPPPTATPVLTPTPAPPSPTAAPTNVPTPTPAAPTPPGTGTGLRDRPGD